MHSKGRKSFTDYCETTELELRKKLTIFAKNSYLSRAPLSFSIPTMNFLCEFNQCNFRSKSKVGIATHSRYCKYNPENGEGQSIDCTANIVPGKELNKELNLSKLDNTDNQKTRDSLPISCEETILGRVEEVTKEMNDNYEETDMPDVFDPLKGNTERHIERVIDTLAVTFCLIERKAGRKLVEDVINTIRSENFIRERFKSGIKNLRDCKQRCREMVKRSFSEDGFMETVVTDKQGKYQGRLFQKDVIKLLQLQVAKTDRENFYIHPLQRKNSLKEDIHSHLFETKYTRDIRDRAALRIVNSIESNVMWYDSRNSRSESFIGMFQLYSDKSAVTMTKAGISAYPVHILFMNFDYSKWKETIVSNRSIVAYLPVEFDSNEDLWRFDQFANSQKSISRQGKIDILHDAYRKILQPLEDVALRGFECQLKSGKKLLCHPIIMEIATDIPEGKDLACVLHGAKTNYPCVRCLCPAVELNCTKKHKERSCQWTNDIRMLAAVESGVNNDLNKMKESAVRLHDEILRQKSVGPTQSYFENTQLLLQDELNNVYRAIGFECMHNFDLGISKEIKSSIYKMLSSEEKTLNGNERRGEPMKNVKNILLKGVNDMLRQIQTESSVNGMNVDFSSKSSSAGLNGLFTSQGLTGMLEAKDWRAVDYVFPFIASFIDRICESNRAPLTSIAVLYIEIIKMTVDHDGLMQWTGQKIKELRAYITNFQELVKAYLGEYQTSTFNTIKFHLLNHIASDIENFGDLRMLEVRFFENRHNQYKMEWSRTSKRKASEFKETICRLEDSEMLSVIVEKSKSRDDGKKPDEDESGRRSRGKEQKGLARNGGKMKVFEFRLLLEHVKWKLKDFEGEIQKDLLVDMERKFSETSIGLLKQVGDQGGKVFLDLLREEVHGSSDYFEHLQTVKIVSSGVIDGGFSCSRDDVVARQGEIRNIRRSRSLRQRCVAVHNYRNTKKPKFSFVIMENGLNCVGQNQCYAVAQVRALFWHQCDGILKQYAIVRYMEAVKPKDIFERHLGCAILRWSTDDEIDYTAEDAGLFDITKPPSPWFDVVEFSRIKSVVQVIRLKERLKEESTESHWSRHRYALNRFMDVKM